MKLALARFVAATRRRCNIFNGRMVFVYDGSLSDFKNTINYKLYYERSALQAADIYTKAFTVTAEWVRACKLINHLDPTRCWGGRIRGAAA